MIDKSLPQPVAELMALSTSKKGRFIVYSERFKELEAKLIALKPEHQILLVELLAQWELDFPAKAKIAYHAEAIILYFLNNTKSRLSFNYQQLLLLLKWLLDSKLAAEHWSGVPEIISTLESYLNQHQLTEEITAYIEKICFQLGTGGVPASEYKILPYTYESDKVYGWAIKLRLLGRLDEHVSPPIINFGIWAETVIQDTQALPVIERRLWIDLFNHCLEINSSKPTKKWLKIAKSLIDQIGSIVYKKFLLKWLPAAYCDSGQLLLHPNVSILRGMIWLCAGIEDPALAQATSALAAFIYLNDIDCIRLANACVWVLGQMPGQEALAQLSFLKSKIKFGSAQIEIEKALTVKATASGLSIAELEEMSIPLHGMEEVGIRRQRLGEFTAELRILDTTSVKLSWLKPDGNPQTSVPKTVKDNFSEELKELKQIGQTIQKTLPAQRDRIESFYRQQKDWDFATWQSRYLNHPLVGTLARRLIWQFSEGDNLAEGIWLSGQLVNHNDQPLNWVSNRTQVNLWHPISSPPEKILAWRNWLVTHQVQQPFKQAHREIYLLTAAEELTRTYSNRFAAHILKQHQFNALCSQRGWKYSLLLRVDDCVGGGSATLLLPAWNLRAEFWVDAVIDDEGFAVGYTHVATDQVRFYNLTDLNEPAPLETLHALSFSEVIRDVDLFVGVASVGNDPTWIDGRSNNHHYNYWQGYSFGDLSETAKTRRQVLETLIPRLQIRDRCHFQDKFLIVRGDLRTYKIHLGSGNILMEPNNQYLCIVTDQRERNSSKGKVFLPFEGDGLISVILSKALLLAADSKIQDPTILAQIKQQ